MPKSTAVVTYRSAGGVVIDQGQMLLLDRPSRGEVRLPKGHIEDGEDIQTAALREVTEESGYADLVVVAPLGSRTVEFEYQGRHVRREEHYLLMALASNAQAKRSKKDAAQFFPIWKSLDEAVSLLTFPAEQEVAQQAALVYRTASASAPSSQ